MPLTVGKHLGGSSELTVVMPVKQGFVDTRDTRTYATRARLLLKTLNAVRTSALEASLFRAYAEPIEKLRTIYFARFTVFDNESKLLLAVAFDSPWEPYIRKIWRYAGSLLDAICCNCEGYEEEHRSEFGYDAFARWVRKHQVPSDFFYSSAPDLTVDDLRYLRDLERHVREGKKSPAELAELTHRSPTVVADDDFEAYKNASDSTRAQADGERSEAGLRALQAFYNLAPLYPKTTTSRAHEFLRLTANAVVPLTDLLSAAQIQTVARGPFKRYQRAVEWLIDETDAHIPAPMGPEQPAELASVQGNILRAYGDRTHGCLLLIRIDDADRGRAYLAALSGMVTTAKRRPNGQRRRLPAVTVNVFVTCRGLETLGCPAEVLSRMPQEFREGMAARAGLLGDVRSNHPDNWQLPPRNWDKSRFADGDRGPVDLGVVDLIVQLQLSSKNASYRKGTTQTDHPLYDSDGPLTDMLQTLTPHQLLRTPLDRPAGVELVSVQELRRFVEKGGRGRKLTVKEHFGFADGISQPWVPLPGSEPRERDEVPFGALLHGYPQPADPCKRDPWLDDGSFVVIRKLEQDVDRFRNMVAAQATGIPVEELEAQLMGRYTAGAPVVNRDAGATNDFDFVDESNPGRCPFHAHIRRANPRDTDNPSPRIARRGFSYGGRNSDSERGLMFIAFNASIAEQFEVIQRWISGGNGSGAVSAQSDPFLGVPMKGQPRIFQFRHNDDVERVDLGDEPFVTLRWGLYLFAPSMHALRLLARVQLSSAVLPDAACVESPTDVHPAAPVMQVSPAPTQDAQRDEAVERGSKVIDDLGRLEEVQRRYPPSDPNELAEARWKQLLEDYVPRVTGASAAAWASIRANGGVLRTPYGVLVGDYEHAMAVLRDTDAYSVRQYWDRMDRTVGANHLGMDPKPRQIGAGAHRTAIRLDERYRAAIQPGQYEDESETLNAAIAGAIDDLHPYATAFAATAEAIAGQAGRLDGDVNVRILGAQVLAVLSNAWIGIPLDGTTPQDAARRIDDVISAARYIFTPNPTVYVEETAVTRGRHVLKDARDYVDDVLTKLNSRSRSRRNPQADWEKRPLSASLFRSRPLPNEDQLARMLTGLVNGLVAPTLGSFVSIMLGLVKTKQLWRVQQAIPVSDGQGEPDGLEAVVINAMRQRPMPDLIHRQAVTSTKLAEVDIKPGDRIVVSIASATQDPDGQPDVLFGGDYDSNYGKAGRPPHACAGQQIGTRVLVGMVAAVLASGTLKAKGPFTLNVVSEQPSPTRSGKTTAKAKRLRKNTAKNTGSRGVAKRRRRRASTGRGTPSKRNRRGRG